MVKSKKACFVIGVVWTCILWKYSDRIKDYLLGAENTVMKKLKIAVDARTLGSRPSGVGMYLNDFLEQLITYDEFEWINKDFYG